MASLIATLRSCLADIKAFDGKLDDPAGDGSGDDARSPNGDDYNEIMDMLSPVFGALAGSPTVHVVTGEHFNVPGTRVSVHATKEDANARALELVNLMLRDTKANQEPATDWEEGLVWLQDYHGAQHCNVAISDVKLEG